MAWKVVLRHFFAAGLAVFLLAAANAIIPSSLVLRVQSLVVADGNLILDRQVLFPVYAEYSQEVERLTEPAMALLACNRSGRAWYERRETPFTYPIRCEFPEGPNDVWQLRACWQVKGMFGISLLPSCITTQFRPNEKVGALEQKQLKKQVLDLESQINQLRGNSNAATE